MREESGEERSKKNGMQCMGLRFLCGANTTLAGCRDGHCWPPSQRCAEHFGHNVPLLDSVIQVVSQGHLQKPLLG